MALVLHHMTLGELAARLREDYRNLSGEQLCKIARFIVRHIQAGDFTETQVRNAFGLTVNQWNALKTKMQALTDAYDTVQAATGE
jgi:hypothetical protein